MHVFPYLKFVQKSHYRKLKIEYLVIELAGGHDGLEVKDLLLGLGQLGVALPVLLLRVLDDTLELADGLLVLVDLVYEVAALLFRAVQVHFEDFDVAVLLGHFFLAAAEELLGRVQFGLARLQFHLSFFHLHF